MAQQQNDSLNQMPTSENAYMNDVTGKSFPQNGNNLDQTKNVSNMNESQKGKPSGPNGNSAAGPVGMPPAHNDASSMHLGPYGHPMQHHHMPPEIDQQQQPLEHMYNPQAPPYGRYHDPNMPPMDMYGRYHPGGLEMKMPPNRPPPQRYPQQQPQTSASNQQQQQSYSAHPTHGPHSGEQAAQEQTQQPPNPIGQTPTLNSLLQSHQTAGPPQPHHHRYPNSYEQQTSQQPAYGAQTWNPSAAPQQRPYSPQMGQQAYRPPPPNANAARIHPSMSSYPPPPPQQNQSAQLGPAGAMQYSPYPQRYPTPPGSVATGTSHRPAYPASHQYPTEQSRPWPPPTGPTAQQTHGHAPHQHPPSPQHHVTAQSPVHAPSPSPQPPQPSNSPHQEICQNSNDSSAPGATTNTPNSMAMRPTPSPTGSSGSRSMSPAVPPQNHRPPYPHPGDQQPIDPAAQQQRSPMIPSQSASDFYEKRNLQGNYPTPPSPHKYPPPPQAAGPNAMPPQGMPPYGSQSQQFPQGNYPTRPQYPSNYGQVNGPANAPHVPNQNQYGRPMPNQTQYPQGNYPTPPSPHMHGAYKGGAVNGPAPNAAPGGSPRPLNHLKQHLLHKGGYGNQSPTSPQSFVNGPGMHQPMGPPQMQAPTRMQVPGSMGPPFSPHHNSQAGNTHQGGLPESQDNGVSSGSSASSQHPVTSVVTTGPDGTTIDEASQQSTISNASAASDQADPQCSTPKRKTDAYNQSHLASAGSTPTMHDDFEMGSPTWPRTPASPVFNSHTEPTPHRSSSKQKSDSLCKLYEMDDSPERRPFLDKLLSFMEERRTPITACPTISKQPLDLYRLYTLVKERGGFVEVCKVTKSKIWKDVAGLLGIGASSSAAYTLRKHYTKNLLAFECQYDRGGIDPLPIIQQVEAGSKKKTPKPASAPSPDANHKGSSNSQDSFTQAAQIQSPPGSSSASMDSFNAYPPPPQQQQTQQQPPATGPNAPVPAAYPPQPPATGKRATASPQYPEQQPYGPPTQQPPFQQPQQGQFAAPNRYPPYGDGPDARYNQHQPPPPPASQQAAAQAPPAAQAPTGPIPPTGPPSQYPQAGPPPQQFEYRQQEPPQSRRHPDFAKESQYPPAPGPYNQRPQLYPNWQGNASPSHFNRQYPQAPQQWGNQRLPGPPVMGAPVQNAQWEQHRYPPQSAQPPYPGNQVQPPQWSGMNQSAMGNVPNAIRPPQRGQIPGKNIPGNMPPPQSAKPQVAQFPSAAPVKRDIVFPSDSVEAVTPLLYRRKRLSKNDIGQTDMWRIFMCLQSGLLSESTWALDVLNILLFDDSSIQWFSLAYLPGLLTMLLDHFQKSLTDMFDSNKFSGRPAKPQLKAVHKKRTNNDNEENEEDDDGLLMDSKDSVDLGQVTKPPNPNDRLVVLHSTTNYTMCSRKGVPVRIKEADDDIFVLNSKRMWDIHGDIDHQNNLNGDSDAWTYGHTDPDPFSHIIDPFKGEFVNIPFARFIKSSERKRKSSIELTTTTTTESKSNDAPKSDNGDSKKSTVNSPNPSVKEEKVEEINDEPKVVETINADADKAVAIDSKAKEDVKGEPMDTDDSGTTKQTDDTVKCDDNEPTKKEQSPVMDSDCREVDMELDEKISNGPRSNEATANPKECESKKSEETINTQPTFDVKKTIQDPAETLKRRRISDYEDECYARDEASLYLISENQDTLARRCLSISNILRNLTFVPGNETVFANSETFLAILGRILLLHHKHPVRTQTIRNYDREDDNDFSDSCSSLQGENEWWWDYLIQLRENMMVAVANIAGHMQLANYDELITRPCLDGLLHWAICPSAHGQDPFPSSGPNSALSPQRLALEALCKICVTDANVDLVIATPPFSRLENLCSVLTRHLCRNEDQVLREFSVNLLHYLASAESSMARTVALQSPCISYLVAFIEQAEQTALGIANQHGINYLRENPDSMGTSLDMLRRTAGTLLHLARHPDNRPLFLQQEQRLLGLVMSHILDQQVALIISRVLFQVSRGGGLNESPVKKVKRRPLPHTNGKLAPNTESSIPVS